MSMTLSDAVTALQVHARQLEAVQVVAAAISDASKIDQLVSEGHVRLASINEEAAKATATLATIQASIDDARKQIPAVQAQAADILDKAKSDADALRSKAESDYNQILAQAALDAEKAIAPVKASREGLQKSYDQLTVMYRELESDFSAKQKLVDDLDAKAAKLRDFIKGLAVE